MQDRTASFPLGKIEFVILMAGLMSLNALAIDIMLPALGLMADEFGIASDNDRQWVITSYLYGMAMGSIVYGSLSDRYGRKPVLLITTAVYVIFAVYCAYSSNYTLILVARFIQGLAAAAMSVLVNSIIRDRFVGDAMARTMSIIMMVFMAVPVTAPILGQIVLLFADWHAIFLVLALFGVVMLLWISLRLPETLNPNYMIPINMTSILQTWKTVIFNRNALGHVLGSGLMMGPLFAFIASSQQLFFDTFDAGDIFVFIFAINASAMALCSFINSRIVMRFGARRVSQSALITFILISLFHWAITVTGLLSLPLFVLLLATSMGMVGFTGSNFSSIAMQPFGQMAGAASSFQNFTRTVISASIGAAIGLQYDGTSLPLVVGFVICGCASLLLILWAEKGVLFRRVQQGVTDQPLSANQPVK